jgi:hypothetical protein
VSPGASPIPSHPRADGYSSNSRHPVDTAGTIEPRSSINSIMALVLGFAVGAPDQPDNAQWYHDHPQRLMLTAMAPSACSAGYVALTIERTKTISNTRRAPER